MKKKFLLLFSLATFLSGFSQEMMNSIPMVLKTNRDVFQVVNEEKKETLLFISDRKKVTALLLNEKMLITDSISLDRPEKKYEDIVGYSGDNSNPVIYWSSKDHTKLYSQFYDLKNHTISENSFEVSLKGEEFLQYFQDGGFCYMLTTVKKSSILKLYEFEPTRAISHEIDLAKLNLVDKNNKTYTFANELKDGQEYNFNYFRLWPFVSDAKLAALTSDNNLWPSTKFNLELIKPEMLTPLTVSAEKLKCYVKPNTLVITSDLNPAFTQMIAINLKTFTPTLQIYEQTEIAAKNRNSNSFLIDDKLFQLTLYDTAIYVTVKDLDGNIISKNVAVSSEPIPFKNAEVVRQSTIGTKRVLEKTSQLLQKINNDRCAISVYKQKGNYLLTIGSVSKEQRATTFTSTSITFPKNGFDPTVTHSRTFINFNSSKNYFDAYLNRKIVYMNSIFDSELKHRNGDFPELAFDKMQKFSERFYDVLANTVFKFGPDYYFTYYNQTNKQYIIRQFTD